MCEGNLLQASTKLQNTEMGTDMRERGKDWDKLGRGGDRTDWAEMGRSGYVWVGTEKRREDGIMMSIICSGHAIL